MIKKIGNILKDKAKKTVLNPLNEMVDENITDITTTIGSFIIRSIRGKFQRSITFTVGMLPQNNWMDEALYGILYEYNDIKSKSKLELTNHSNSFDGSGMLYILDDGTHNLKYRKWNILLFIQTKTVSTTQYRSSIIKSYTIITYDLDPEFCRLFEKDMIRNRNSLLKIKADSPTLNIYKDYHEHDGYTYWDQGLTCSKRKLSSLYLPYEQKKKLVDTLNFWFTSKELYKEHGIPWNLKILLYGPHGPQPYSLEIPTPDGMKKFGDLKIGDEVFTNNGLPTKIVDIFERGELDVYKITFSDGRSTLCAANHNWPILHKDGNIVKKTTEEMLNESLYDDFHKRKFSIPMSNCVNFKYHNVKIDPWVLGVFIGNGCMLERYLTLSSPNAIIPRYVANKIGASFKKEADKNYNYKFYEKDTGKLIKTEDFFKDYQEICDYSYNKKIPNDYLMNSYDVRIGLLQGLMDTDGCVTRTKIDKYNDSEFKRYEISYSTTSNDLKEDILFLIRSLGYSVSVSIDSREDKYTKGVCYTINIHTSDENKYLFFRYSHKLKRAFAAKFQWRNKRTHIRPFLYITDIEKLDYKEKMRCIEVEDELHLYQTSDFITTCNCGKSSIVKIIASEWNRNIYEVTGGKNGKFIPNAISDFNTNVSYPLYSISDIDKYPMVINEPDTNIQEKDGAKESALDQKQVFGNMLNALDGVASGEGKIIVMTTNHIEKFSETFLRPGRVDLCMEIGYVVPEVFRKYVYDFYNVELPKDIKLVSDKLTIAELQKDVVFMKLSADEFIKKYVK